MAAELYTREIEVLGFVVEGVPFYALPGWLQLATGSPVVVGTAMLCAAVFFLAPSELNRNGTDTVASRVAAIGVAMLVAGIVAIVAAIFTLPTLA